MLQGSVCQIAMLESVIHGMRLPVWTLSNFLRLARSINVILRILTRTADQTTKTIIRKAVKASPHDIGIAISWHRLLDIVLWTRRLWGVRNTMDINEDITRSLRISFFGVGIMTRCS